MGEIAITDHAYNARADQFLATLHRVRDLTLTAGDYFWLCNLKRSKRTLQEREAFKAAPILMDFRRATAGNPEDNCEYYNRMLNRALAREQKQPVIGFSAVHAGINQSQGEALDDSRFSGLPSRFELSEDAWLILTHNLKPELGLMNGTRGTAKRIIYARGCHPNHDDPAQRLPALIIFDVPKYTGPPFFPEPERKTWIPIFPRTVADEDDKTITRTQFPFVLGWALTPWKAQGMTLDKVIVKLGRAVSEPGVLFVALSRVRHPDDLMLDDSFPALFEILKQAKHPSFAKRQHWEKLMRVRFARTLRMHMRDADMYIHPGTHVWSEDDALIADKLLNTIRVNLQLADDEIFVTRVKHNAALNADVIQRVLEHLHTFPYVFEIADARRSRMLRYRQ